jgi:hypothetical protein
MSIFCKWYGRVTVAVLCAAVACALGNSVWISVFDTAFIRSLTDGVRGCLYFFYSTMFPMLICLSAYGILTSLFSLKRPDNETHCRRCGYILCGITEPQCSECGERI